MSSTQQRDQLTEDMQSVIKDAEELLNNSELQASEGFKKARARFENTLGKAKAELVRLEEVVVDKTKDAARATDSYIKENPWQAVGLGAAVGLVIGMLISRK